jgi:hypothetical protein
VDQAVARRTASVQRPTENLTVSGIIRVSMLRRYWYSIGCSSRGSQV